MKKYRVYNENGYFETIDYEDACKIANNKLENIEVINFDVTDSILYDDKREQYQNLADHITLEITRKMLLKMGTEEEISQLIERLRDVTNLISKN